MHHASTFRIPFLPPSLKILFTSSSDPHAPSERFGASSSLPCLMSDCTPISSSTRLGHVHSYTMGMFPHPTDVSVILRMEHCARLQHQRSHVKINVTNDIQWLFLGICRLSGLAKHRYECRVTHSSGKEQKQSETKKKTSNRRKR